MPPPTVGSRALLDASSAPMLPSARETLLACLDEGWADPRRLYAEARRSRGLLDQAREVIAAGLGVRPPELSFLPSGPAALGAGTQGLLYAARRRGARLVTSAVDHSAVLTLGRYLAAQSERPDDLAEVPVHRSGAVDLDAWRAAVTAPGTAASVLQSANGEIGTRQPVPAARAALPTGVALLVDAQASLGRDEAPSEFDALVGDARSFGGPPGVGLLVVRTGVRWRRPGPATELESGRTDVEPVLALALAAAQAWQDTEHDRAADAAEARDLVQRVRAAATAVPDVEVAGDPRDRLPHVVTFSALYVDGEALVHELDRRGFAVASGSACTASTLEASHVLAATGMLTHGNVRVTLPLRPVAAGRAAQVDRFCAEIGPAVAAVRAQLGVAGL